MNRPLSLQQIIPVLPKQKNIRRGQVLKWLRKTHGWLGLWGAVLGLLFGLSGFLLNHRAVMKIPAAQMEVSEIQLPVPEPQPANAAEFARFLQSALDISHAPAQRPPRREAGNVQFLGKERQQPQVITVDFQLPQSSIHGEYITGNRFATIQRQDANFWGFIMRMHKGAGMNTAWILLVDSLAGALIILSVTGILLWSKMRGSRLTLAGLTGASLLLTVLITMQSM
ncbi:MAG TPA: PepSY-associated TM helix domain-containing protein [Methylophilaceae bacterium]|nr:PepSY-associated TM helix domain-containing protein [Methylophilaceae bacterium]